MMGFEDASIAFVWVATVVVTVLCIGYGMVMWNKGEED